MLSVIMIRIQSIRWSSMWYEPLDHDQKGVTQQWCCVKRRRDKIIALHLKSDNHYLKSLIRIYGISFGPLIKEETLMQRQEIVSINF